MTEIGPVAPPRVGSSDYRNRAFDFWALLRAGFRQERTRAVFLESKMTSRNRRLQGSENSRPRGQSRSLAGDRSLARTLISGGPPPTFAVRDRGRRTDKKISRRKLKMIRTASRKSTLLAVAALSMGAATVGC